MNLALIRLYARALRGQRARGTRPQKRGKNVSMIAAISLKEIVASVNILGAADGLTNASLCDSKTRASTLARGLCRLG